MMKSSKIIFTECDTEKNTENVSCIDLSTSLFYVFFSVSHSVTIILDDFMIAKTIASEWY